MNVVGMKGEVPADTAVPEFKRLAEAVVARGAKHGIIIYEMADGSVGFEPVNASAPHVRGLLEIALDYAREDDE